MLISILLKARVAQIVGEMIKESGLTQRAMAARLALAHSDVSNIQRGNLKKFNLVRLLVCLRALGSEIKVKRAPVKQPSEVDEAEKRKGRMSLMVASLKNAKQDDGRRGGRFATPEQAQAYYYNTRPAFERMRKR
jgi:predicted XRE-type DNA-binding protein